MKLYTGRTAALSTPGRPAFPIPLMRVHIVVNQVPMNIIIKFDFLLPHIDVLGPRCSSHLHPRVSHLRSTRRIPKGPWGIVVLWSDRVSTVKETVTRIWPCFFSVTRDWRRNPVRIVGTGIWNRRRASCVGRRRVRCPLCVLVIIGV